MKAATWLTHRERSIKPTWGEEQQKKPRKPQHNQPLKKQELKSRNLLRLVDQVTKSRNRKILKMASKVFYSRLITQK